MLPPKYIENAKGEGIFSRYGHRPNTCDLKSSSKLTIG